MSLQGHAVGDVLDREIEFVAGDEIDARPAIRLFSGSTATLAPMKPILTFGLSALIISAVFTSDLKDGVDVCMHDEVPVREARGDVLER